jgi:hypothetical protein
MLIKSCSDRNSIAWSPNGSKAYMGGDGLAIWTYDGGFATIGNALVTGSIIVSAHHPTDNLILFAGTDKIATYDAGAASWLEVGSSLIPINGAAWSPSGTYAVLCGGDTYNNKRRSIVLLFSKDENRVIKVETNVPNEIGRVDWEPTHNLILGGKIQ